MHESDAKQDERDDGTQAARPRRSDAPDQAQARELRAAAAAETAYILRVLGR
jgi:hypothetical protein